jgi:hypothetical protein
LVPDILPDLPTDPYTTNAPFHYRVSDRENIVYSQKTTRGVERGRGILWSVGPDMTDNGGTDPQRDVLFFVPRPGAIDY